MKLAAVGLKLPISRCCSWCSSSPLIRARAFTTSPGPTPTRKAPVSSLLSTRISSLPRLRQCSARAWAWSSSSRAARRGSSSSIQRLRGQSVGWAPAPPSPAAALPLLRGSGAGPVDRPAVSSRAIVSAVSPTWAWLASSSQSGSPLTRWATWRSRRAVIKRRRCLPSSSCRAQAASAGSTDWKWRARISTLARVPSLRSRSP